MLWHDGPRVGSGRSNGKKKVGADKESSERDLPADVQRRPENMIP